jgi:O-antigen/teichoic acid export membrane protein
MVSGLLTKSFRLKGILLSGASGLASKGINMLSTMFTIYVVNSYFSDERFSIYLIIMSLLGMLGFADLGLGYGLFNQLAKDNDDVNKMKESISTTFIFLLVVALILSLVSLGFIFFTPNWNLFNSISSVNIAEGNMAAYIFLLLFAVTLPFTLIRKIQGAFQEAYKGDIWDIVGNISCIVIFMLLVNNSRGLIFLIITMFGVKNIAVILNFIYYFYFRRRELQPRLRNFNKEKLAPILKDGIMFFFLQIIAVALNSGDTFLISRYFGTAEAANYAIAYRVFTFYFVPVLAIMTPFLAANNNALAQKDFNWLKKSFKKTFYVILGVSILSGAFYIFSTNYFISIWLGNTRKITTPFLISFAAFIVYSNFNALYSQMMMSYVFVKSYIYIYAITGAFVLIAKLIIGHYGLSPAYFVWSTVILSTILYFLPAHILFIKTSFGKMLFK